MEKGGRTKRISEQFRGLQALGHEVKLLTFSEPPEWVLEHFDASEDWLVFSKNPSGFDVGLLLRLRKFVRDFNPDLIDAHCEGSAFYLGIVGRLCKTPIVATIHRSSLKYYDGSWKLRLYYRFVDTFIAVSAQRRSLMASALHCSEARVQVMHWGIDLEAFGSPPARAEAREKLGLDESPLLLSIGHLGAIKGHDDSIMALSTIHESYPTARLCIAGDGEPRDFRRLRARAEDHGVSDAVSFLGQTTNIIDWLRACDVFLQPSREEAFGLVFLEAGLMEVPTVATKVGGIPEIVESEVTGILVEPEMPHQIAVAVCRLLGDPPLAARMGARAKQIVEDRFSLEARVRDLSVYFEQLAKFS
jgi:glycosyltransferase involved in cell wall biosynthesis